MTTTLNASTAGAGGFIATSDNSGILALQTAGTTAITVDASQQVGIGGTPVKTLSILPTSIRRMDFYVRDPGVDDSLVIRSQHATNNNIRDMILEGSIVKVFTGADSGGSGTESMRIDSSGNLLVGYSGSSAYHRFYKNNVGDYVAQIVNTASSSAYGIAITYTASAPNGTSNQFLDCADTGGARAKFYSNGGLANYQANNANLSDQREKKNIELAPNYLDKICQIPVKTFLFNDQTDTDLNLGAIAQDVQAVCPELVMESNWAGKDQPEKMRLSIYQTDLQYALMKSIQELKAINDTQAETINALTARIVAIEQR
jgi:hypothetical protein